MICGTCRRNDGAISTLRILPPFATEYKITMNAYVPHGYTCVDIMSHRWYALTIIRTICHYVHVFDTKFRVLVHFQNAFIKLSILQSTWNISEIMKHPLMRILTKPLRI